MHPRLRPVAFNEVSSDVAVLHRTLAVLGFAVAQDELRRCRAGNDTRAKIRALRAQLNVPVDDAALLDEATIDAVHEALEKRGLTAASRSFTVNGTVRLPDGSAKQRQRLLAFDLDLGGVAVYRNVQTLAEIQDNAGFEFLGQTVSDSRGGYHITFYDWQYRRAERKKADVVVYAVEQGEAGGRIVGRSRLVNTNDYSDQGLVQDLDIIVAQTDSRTEYEQLMTALEVFLRESESSLAEISTSREQLAFTASELDLEPAHLDIAAAAELLLQQKTAEISHELLYGIGRQDIHLAWPVLYRKPEDELRRAIATSSEARIIRVFNEQEVTAFIRAVRDRSVREVLSGQPGEYGNTLNAMLANALPEESQRLSFLNAVATFKGSAFDTFWNEHLPGQPEFQDNPQLVADLLFSQQLTHLTGNHQTLVNELREQRKLDTIDKLFELETHDWLELVEKTGVPDFVSGENDEEKIHAYAESMQSILNAAFPTRRIARMLEKDQLPIERTVVSRGVKRFLADNAQFDFAASRIHDFKAEIAAVAGENNDRVRDELKKIQRVFQVSPTPEAMRGLMEHNLHSAYTIANIPRKSFLKTYASVLGGEILALAIHERASHINTRAEMAAMHIMEYSHSVTPKYAMGETEYSAALDTIKEHLPNPTPTYAQLFGSPDICECKQCRSVYSAAAYLVDLLRFLWRGAPNSAGKIPLDVLVTRRPDLLHLPLSCQNTNTITPYIDLANEVMEFYTANDSLTTFKGHDTGKTTAEELRANPQNFNLEAYRKLNDEPYPFALPYHQPLDVIRVYSDHLTVSRYEAMKAVHPQPDATTAAAIAAEALRLSEEEYIVLTGKAFDGTVDTTALHEYFGYTAADELESLSAVPEFLQRSGVAYTDLVELVKTQFINPHQGTLDFPKKIAAQVISLYEPDSKCDLEKTQLRTMQSIYTGSASSGIAATTWSKIHRFIRLWRRLGKLSKLGKLEWTIYETDLILAALGENDITTSTITKLEAILLLQASTKLTLSQLAVAWGSIDTAGEQALYRKLFLNKAVQQIDTAFEADAWGQYLQDTTAVLADHQSAILAAFLLREDELAAILRVAKVVDGGNARLINIKTDSLNLGHLSTIYRYAMLAKALKIQISDLCKLVELFGVSPFSSWDIQQQQFVNLAPDKTLKFYQLVDSIKQAGFKAEVLEYILKGTLPADSKIGLDKTKVLQAAKTIRDTFSAIELDHPENPPSPLTSEILSAKLALTFQAEIVTRFMAILDDTAAFQTLTDANLDVTIPDTLSRKYSYVKGSGRLTCTGIMSDAERTTLKGLANASANFKTAVDTLYAAPERFISTNFSGILSSLTDAKATLLDHPPQSQTATLGEKLTYIYERFIPFLKRKLRRDAITQHVAALIGLSEAATAVLIAQDVDGSDQPTG